MTVYSKKNTNIINKWVLEGNTDKVSRKCKWALLVAALFRTILQMGIPVWMRADYDVDDMLFVNYAQSILESGWLGEYNSYTLNKMPAFGFFLALIKSVNMPYMMALGLGYSLASVLFFFAFRKWIKNDRVAYICYLFVLFSPIMMDYHLAQIYRNSIIPMLVLIIISCYFAIYYNRTENCRKLLPWSIGCGVAFGAFCLTREDSIWLVCFVVGAIIVIIGKLLLETRTIRGHIQRVICIVLPAIICFGSLQAVKFTNYVHYGIYVTTDFNDTYYAKAMKAILVIEPEEEIDRIPITKSTFEKLYEVSPTLKSIESKLEAYIEMTANDDGESNKGKWLLRWAADSAGIYDDPQEANAFWKQVYEEVEEGFETGSLQRQEGVLLSTLSFPIEASDVKDILSFAGRGLWKSIGYSMISCKLSISFGNENNMELMSNITSSIPITDSVANFSGWIVAYDDDSTVLIELEENGEKQELTFESSGDVYEYFADSGEFYQNAKTARFSYSSETSLEQVQCNIYLNGEQVYSDLLKNVTNMETDQFRLTIDSKVLTKTTSVSANYGESYVKLANGITKLYQVTGYVLAVLAGIAFVAEIVINIIRKLKNRKTNVSFWLLKLGLLLTILADVLIVSINYFSRNDYGAFCNYTVGIYPVWQMFICLSLCSAFRYLRSYLKNKDILTRREKKVETDYSNSLLQ